MIWLRLPVPALRFQGPWAHAENRRTKRAEPEPSGVTFSQLVWAHFHWADCRDHSGQVSKGLDGEYRKKLARFEKEHGRLVHVYWSRAVASAVGMTVKRRRRRLDWLPFVERESTVELHRLSDWITSDTHKIADLLHECDLMAVRVGEIRLVYMSGMLYGCFFVALVGVAAIAALDAATGMGRQQLELLALSYGAGALGALISVMSRMVERGSFEIDFELGRPLMRRLGMYRPFVGAVVGVAFYMLLASRFLDVAIPEATSTYYYGFFAFLSGFSERFASVVFGAAESKLGGAKDSSEAAEKPGASAPGA